ncbi:hypothetical protein [Actinocrispum sp. NPDC049592]|uniref:hypothetical protein n=1 Tax=Actinocrispum sp. NPDC049592 TaxID=3154835 RepID=UPI0034256270
MVRRTAARAHLRVISSDCPAPMGGGGGGGARDRYGDLADRHLAAILAAEDTAERHGFNPHVRSTCALHRCWIHECISDPAHVLPETGHRWCEDCESPVDVVVSPGFVRLRCAGCGTEPDSAANREVLHACRTSLAAVRAGRPRSVYPMPDA